MNRTAKRRRVFVLIVIAAVMMSAWEGDQIAVAGMMESIKEFFWGKEYPLTTVKGRILFTSDRGGEAGDRGVYVFRAGQIEKIRDGAMDGSWSSEGEPILCETRAPNAYAIITINYKTRKEKVLIDENEFEKKTGLSILSSFISKDGKRIMLRAINKKKLDKDYLVENAYSVDLNMNNLKQLTFWLFRLFSTTKHV